MVVDAQLEHLLKMAQQIADNMRAEGDQAAARTAEHIRRFWTPAMREMLVDHSRQGGAELPPSVRQVVEYLSDSER